jgi:hypothetical protein
MIGLPIWSADTDNTSGIGHRGRNGRGSKLRKGAKNTSAVN